LVDKGRVAQLTLVALPSKGILSDIISFSTILPGMVANVTWPAILVLVIRVVSLNLWESTAARAARCIWAAACGDAKAPADILLWRLFAREPRTGGSLLIENMIPQWCELGGEAFLGHPCAMSEAGERGRRFGARPIIVFGDSHSRLYLRRTRQDNAFLFPIGVVKTGASARGLTVRDSESATGMARAIEHLRDLPHTLPVLFVFGQVDIEFIYAFKLAEAGEHEDRDDAFYSFMEETLDRYVGWLTTTLRPNERAGAFLAPIFPPALDDKCWSSGYMNAQIARHSSLERSVLCERIRAIQTPTLLKRTQRHSAFNRELRTRAAVTGMKMLPDYDEICEGGVVAPYFQGPRAGADHHLDHAALRDAIVPRLWLAAAH
jgi:hypothetical protein